MVTSERAAVWPAHISSTPHTANSPVISVVSLDTVAVALVAAAAVLAVGGVLFEFSRRRFAQQWSAVQSFIEKKINKEDVQ